MLGVTNTKYAFRQHLSHIGFLMDQPRQVVAQELCRHMGLERFAHCEHLSTGAQRGEEDWENRVYDFLQDLREANLYRCLSPDVTLDTSYFLYEKAQPFLTPGKRLIELGCWTGGLTSFIADNHPDCTVIGVDRVTRILELNCAHYRLSNLSFELWDYRADKPEDLAPADILMCGLGTSNDCPPGAYTPRDSLIIRELAGYQREKQEASRYFAHWRQAAKDDACLFTVLRVLTVPRFLAFIDAAQETGWTPLLDQLQLVSCPGNKERIPALAFVARASQPISEDIALAHWMGIWLEKRRLGIRGAPALALYRALGPKLVVAEREGRDSAGHAVREELGTCGALGYFFSQDTRPEYVMSLMSIPEVVSQCQSAGQPQQHAPGAFTITVDGGHSTI